MWKLEGNKPVDGETSTKGWSSTHVEKAAKGNSLSEEGNMLFSPAFVSGYQLKNNQMGMEKISFYCLYQCIRPWKWKKYVWDFIQGIAEHCVAFNEIIQTR